MGESIDGYILASLTEDPSELAAQALNDLVAIWREVTGDTGDGWFDSEERQHFESSTLGGLNRGLDAIANHDLWALVSERCREQRVEYEIQAHAKFPDFDSEALAWQRGWLFSERRYRIDVHGERVWTLSELRALAEKRTIIHADSLFRMMQRGE